MSAGWIVTLVLGGCVVFFLVTMAIEELRKPVTLRQALAKPIRGLPNEILLVGGLIFGMFLTINGVMSREEARVTDALEFRTGMTQALERVAYLRGGDPGAFREWSGQARDGERYTILRDDAGGLVRAENLSGPSCRAVLSYLSPYAASVLVMRDGRGVIRIGEKGKACPDGDERIQAVFRAPG